MDFHGASSFPIFIFNPWFDVGTSHDLDELSPLPGAVTNYLDPQVLNAALNPPPGKLLGDSPILRSTPIDDLHGWPMLCLRSSVDETTPEASIFAEGIVLETTPYGSLAGDLITMHRALPLTVMPVGFAANSAFYAGVLLIPFVLRSAIRAVRRRGRNLCPACAYDLRGQTAPGCPECGHARN